MHIHTKTDSWNFYLLIGLGLTIAACVVGSIAFFLLGQAVPGILPALGTVAGAGLVKLLISPLNRELIGFSEHELS